MKTKEKHRAIPSERYRLPEVCFRKNYLGQFIPDSPEDLNICMTLGLELQPVTRPWELVRMVRSSIFVRFDKEGDKS